MNQYSRLQGDVGEALLSLLLDSIRNNILHTSKAPKLPADQ